MDESELEEGEITDSGDEEVGEIKSNASNDDTHHAKSASQSRVLPADPLPRPTNPAMSYRAPQEPCSRSHTFRESPGLGGDDSDSDDSEYSGGKKMRIQPHGSAHSHSAAISRQKKKLNIWSDVLLEDTISSKIKSSGTLKSKDADTVERGVESYCPAGESRTVDFDEIDNELAEAQSRVDRGGGDLWNVNDDGESDNLNIRKRAGKKNHIRNRLGGQPGVIPADPYSELPNEICAADDERVIARSIARHLNEPKITLIERVVRYAGSQKAIDLFNATMDVEAAGGMKTIRGDTRRTPGGVFLQLLKTDKHVTKEMVKEIFALERENQKFAKKVFIKDRQDRKRKYRAKTDPMTDTEDTTTTSSSSPKPIPSLLDPTLLDPSLIDDSDLMGEEPDIQIGVAS